MEVGDLLLEGQFSPAYRPGLADQPMEDRPGTISREVVLLCHLLACVFLFFSLLANKGREPTAFQSL